MWPRYACKYAIVHGAQCQCASGTREDVVSAMVSEVEDLHLVYVSVFEEARQGARQNFEGTRQNDARQRDNAGGWMHYLKDPMTIR